MVYGETGRYPLIINAKVRCVCFWSKLLLDRKDKLLSTLYRILYSTQETENIQFKWLSHVKKIFDECGFSYIWSSQITINPEAIKVIIKQRLIDHVYQKMLSNMDISSRGRFYSSFKDNLQLEKYLTLLKK